jgi:opacity protein-like surface antigen
MKSQVFALAVVGVLAGTAGAEEAEVKIARGSVYGALKYYELQVNNTTATVSDPGVFEGRHAIEFDSGQGFGFTLGALSEQDWFFAGFEFEMLKSSADISNPFPTGTIYEDINSFDQLSLNLNLLWGTDISDRLLRPYVFGGIGYTEAELVGHYGLATTSLEEGYDDTFGYHAGIGADLRIYKNLYLDAGYRYYKATDATIKTRGRSIEFANSGQMVYIGLAYIHQTPPVEYTSWQDLFKKSNGGQ